MGTRARTASAIASLGRESISTARPFIWDDDAGVEDVLREVGDDDSVDRAAEVADYRLHEVVRERPGGADALQLHRDRLGLVGADPDRQVALAVDLFEDHHPVLGDEADADAFDHGFDHRCALFGSGSSPGAPARDTRWRWSGRGVPPRTGEGRG
jgi:hypothetical protein